MEPIRDDQLLAALDSLRPRPRPGFAAELDARVAGGFPRRSRLRAFSLAGMKRRLTALRPRQVLLPAGGLALAAIVAATVVVSQDSGSQSQSQEGGAFLNGYSGSEEPLSQPGPAESVPSSEAAAGASHDAAKSFDGSGPYVRSQHRAVERSAEMTLGTDPAGVGDAAAKVFGVVHAHRGIVLNSATSEGGAGEAAAEFELLIPSPRLGDALAAFSEIAEVRSRHEATLDITAPTVGTAERLEDSRARIDGLLAQLADADTEGERKAVEAELRGERGRAAALRAQLQRLDRRADLSRVSLSIESDEAPAGTEEGGAWGVGDALEDAGAILAASAAVLLLALAILGPIALVALLAWLAHRTYVRRARRQALG